MVVEDAKLEDWQKATANEIYAIYGKRADGRYGMLGTNTYSGMIPCVSQEKSTIAKALEKLKLEKLPPDIEIVVFKYTSRVDVTSEFK